MTESEFRNVMEDESIPVKIMGIPNAMQGLKIIAKYCPNENINWAEHDVIGSVDVTTLWAAGITRNDAIRLKSLNWMIDADYGSDTLACFV